jgi:hypothetical protein
MEGVGRVGAAAALRYMGTHISAPISTGTMKTTIEIADPLLEQARTIAARHGTTLRALVERGLHHVIQEAETPAPFRLRRASFKGNGLQPDLGDASWDRIRDLAYQGRGT